MMPEAPAWASPVLAMPDSYTELPCGCQMWNQVQDGDKIFVMRPCCASCPAYRVAVAASGDEGIPVEHYRER